MSSDRKVDKLTPPDRKDELWTANDSNDMTDSLLSSMDCINMDALLPLSNSEKDQLIAKLHQKYLNLQLELYILRDNRKMPIEELNSTNLLRKYRDMQEDYSKLQKTFVDMRDVLAKANSTIELYEKRLQLYEDENNSLKETIKEQKKVITNVSDVSSVSGDYIDRLEHISMKYRDVKTQSAYYRNLYETNQKHYQSARKQIEQLKEQLSVECIHKDDIESLKQTNEELSAKLEEAICVTDTDSIPLNALNVIQKMGKDQKEMYATFVKLKSKYEELKDKHKTLEMENVDLKRKSAKVGYCEDVVVQNNESSLDFRTDCKNDVVSPGNGGCSPKYDDDAPYFVVGNRSFRRRSDLVDYYKSQLIEKDASIERLNEEVKKRTYNLQELVNKELWNKNREIEKLNKLCEKRRCELILLQTQIDDNNRRISSRATTAEVQQLLNNNNSKMTEKPLKKKFDLFIGCDDDDDADKENLSCNNSDNFVKLLKDELHNCIQEKKILSKKIELLEKRTVTNNNDNNNNTTVTISSGGAGSTIQTTKEDNECSLIRNLRLECLKRKEDLEAVEKSRQEAYNACHLLTTRLEELADFLETLLTGEFSSTTTMTNGGNNSNVVGVMSVKKREILKQAIERSREISKSFSASFLSSNATNLMIDLSVPILPDCSEINLSFSGGDNDEDEYEDDIDNNNNNNNDHTLRPISESDDGDNRKSSNYRRHLFDDGALPPDSVIIKDKRSNNNLPSSVLFVNHFDPSDELMMFSSNNGGGRPLITVDSGISSGGIVDNSHYDDTTPTAAAAAAATSADDEKETESLPDVSSLMTDDDRNTVDSLPQQREPGDEDDYDKDTIDSLPDIDSFPDDKATIGSVIDDDRATLDSAFDGPNTTVSEYERCQYRAIKYASRLTTTSSALVSVEDGAPNNRLLDESESEQWSEPDRNVSAERIGLQDSASRRIHKRTIVKQNSPPRRDADSEICTVHHNQRASPCEDNRVVSPSLSDDRASYRKECNHHQSHCSQPQCDQFNKTSNYLPVSDCTEVTNCMYNFDVGKYDAQIKALRRLLQNTIKHLYRTNKADHDRPLIDRLRKISEQFETLVAFCTKFHSHFRSITSRCELLTNILDKTQSQFEQVMIDLRSIKLSYNNVVLEREQNLTLLHETEVARDDLKIKLRTEEEKYRRLERDYDSATIKYRNLLKQLERCKKNNFNDTMPDSSTGGGSSSTSSSRGNTGGDSANSVNSSCQCQILSEQLKSAQDQIDQLKESLPSSQGVIGELTECKRRLDDVLTEKRELEKRELDWQQQSVTCENRCLKLEEEVKLKDNLNRLLSSENEKYRQTCDIVDRLKREITELNTIVEGDHIIVSEKERTIVELRQLNENIGKELAVEKRDAEIRSTEQEIKIREYETELKRTKDELSSALAEKTEQLRAALTRSETERDGCVEQLEKQTKELENMKTQHGKKMKELLYHIMKHRHEEENNVEIHKQLLRQIDELKMQKAKWKNEVTEWKRSYDAIEERKREAERQLQNLRERVCCHSNCVFNAVDDDRSAAGVAAGSSFSSSQISLKGITGENDNDDDDDTNNNNNGNVVVSASSLSATTNDESSRTTKALHQDKSTLSKLEKRVQELETVNKELESRLNQLQIAKVSLSDCELTSGEESSTPSTPSEQTKSLPSPSAILDSPTYDSYVGLSSLNSPTRKSSPSCCDDQVKNDIINQWIMPADDRNKFRRQSDERDSVAELKQSNLNAMNDLATSRTNSATSPDLGIDSDHGRQLSFDECPPIIGLHDELMKLEEENNMLKQQLNSTRSALEETLQKLTSLNRNKKKMEKAIFKQLHKTSSILKKAKPSTAHPWMS